MDQEPLLAAWGSDGVERRRLAQYDYPKIYSDANRAHMHHSARRHSTLAKVLLLCLACIIFLALLYIPVYTEVNSNPVTVSGWSVETNRDTKLYVQPNNITLLHDVKTVCQKEETEPLFLLIVVCSSTVNFQARKTIRETWGAHENYLAMFDAFDAARNLYKDYKFDHDLVIEENQTVIKTFNNKSESQTELNEFEKRNKDSNNKILHESLKVLKSKFYETRRSRRSIKLSDLIPQLAAILKKDASDVKDKNEPTEEVRFPDSEKSEFDIDKVLLNDVSENSQEMEPIDYEDSNVMKIPPKGMETSQSLEQLMHILKVTDLFKKSMEDNKKLDSNKNERPSVKMIFLLGMPSGDNETEVQNQIEEESSRYGDIVQEEAFIDSYNNLTLKSVMMLKWVVNNCDKKVRYVFKTDDDVFLNVPRLVDTVRRRELSSPGDYYIMGSLIRNARPVSDRRSKWYAPQYMYGGKIYPRYLSGTGYLMTLPAVRALYKAALKTPLFHLEDVFITGMCAARADPRLSPLAGEGFTYAAPAAWQPCDAYSRVTLHRVPLDSEVGVVEALRDKRYVARCERIILQNKRNEKLSKEKKLSISAIKNKISKLGYLRDIFI